MKTIALQSIAADEKFAADSSHSYAVSKWRQCEPERELLAAVLEDAVLSYKNALFTVMRASRRHNLGSSRETRIGSSSSTVRYSNPFWPRKMPEARGECSGRSNQGGRKPA